MSGFGSRPTAAPVPVDANRQALAQALLGLPARVGQAFTGMANAGLQANEAFLQGRGTDGEDVLARPLLPGADTGGRLGALASFIGSNMAMGGPAGSLGAGPSMPKRFEYKMMYRPPSNATVPQGFVEFGPATREAPFGTVVYDKPIPFKAEEAFEMWPLDPLHPKNIKQDFEAFQSRFMDQFSSSGERYRGADFSVTPSTSKPDTWQLTTFSRGDNGEMVPFGHLDISDPNELVREVWRRERVNNAKTNPLAGALLGAPRE